jgi:hypothetical protein
MGGVNRYACMLLVVAAASRAVEGTWNVKASTIETSARGRRGRGQDRTGQGHIDGDPSHSLDRQLVEVERGSMKLARAIV